MFDVVKKLMFAREIDFERGNISLLGHPVIMCPVSTFTEIRRMLEVIDATALLYLASKKSGLSYIRTLQKKFGMKPYDLLKWGINTISLAGWGNTEILKFDMEKKTSITILEDSKFVKSYGHSSVPIDDIFRGFAAATASICFGIDSDVIEIKCKSMGAPRCEIIAKPAGEFDLKNPEINKQLIIQNENVAKFFK